MAPRAETFCKEKTKIRTSHSISASITRIFGNIASSLCMGLGKVFVFSVSSRPFIVPNIEDVTSLNGWARGLDIGRVDLRPSWPTFAPDYFLRLLRDIAVFLVDDSDLLGASGRGVGGFC